MNLFPPVISPILRDRPTTFILSGAVLLQFGLTYFGLPGWQCPIFHATGVPCPGCGLSRATNYVLRGEWQRVFRLHIFAPIFLLVLIFIMIVTLLPKNYRHRVIAKLESIEDRTGITYVFLASLFLYWAIRIIVAPEEYISLISAL
jgi:hypothetical protein